MTEVQPVNNSTGIVKPLLFSITYTLIGILVLLPTGSFSVFFAVLTSLIGNLFGYVITDELSGRDKKEVFKAIYRMLPLALVFISYTFLIKTAIDPRTNSQLDSVIFFALVIYLCSVNFIVPGVKVDTTIASLSKTIVRVAIIMLPYILGSSNMGLLSETSVKEAVVVSLLIDTCSDKFRKLLRSGTGGI